MTHTNMTHTNMTHTSMTHTSMEQPAPSGGRLFALLATNAYVINLLLQHWPEPVGSPAL